MPSSVFPSITSNYENYPIFSSTSTVQETLQEPEYMQEQEFTQNEHEPTRLSGRVSSESDAFLFSRPRKIQPMSEERRTQKVAPSNDDNIYQANDSKHKQNHNSSKRLRVQNNDNLQNTSGEENSSLNNSVKDTYSEQGKKEIQQSIHQMNSAKEKRGVSMPETNKKTNNTGNQYQNTPPTPPGASEPITYYNTPFKDLYYDEMDFNTLALMPEKERQMTVFKRDEGVRKYKQLKRLEEELAPADKPMKVENESLEEERNELDDELDKEFQLVEKQSDNEKLVKNLKLDDMQELFMGRDRLVKYVQNNLGSKVVGCFVLFVHNRGKYIIGQIRMQKDGDSYNVRIKGEKGPVDLKLNKHFIIRSNEKVMKMPLEAVSNRLPKKEEFEEYKEGLLKYLNNDVSREFNIKSLINRVKQIKSLIKEEVPKVVFKPLSEMKMTKKQLVKKKIALRTKINSAEMANDKVKVALLERQYQALMTEDDKKQWAPLNTSRPRLACNAEEAQALKQAEILKTKEDEGTKKVSDEAEKKEEEEKN